MSYCACTNERNLRERGPEMSRTKSNGNVLVCGACAVTMSENSESTTSIDLLVNGVKKLFSRKNGRR